MKYILPLVLSIFLSFNYYATHIPGSNITYECLGNNQYVVTLTLFEDCGTAFIGNTSQTLNISNSCGFTSPSSVTVTNTIFQQEVSQLCDSQLANSECNGGTMPGIYMHQWVDTITLPGLCDSWTFSYSSCCRNASTNLVGTSNATYIETVLNSATEPCNTSPTPTTQMIPYVCVNQPVVYNLGIYEPDGHTLVYSLVNSLTNSGTSVPYSGGYSGTTPIPGMTINSVTGDITFTSAITGNFVVAVLIEEYNSNGDLVGSVLQDFQFEVITCPANTNPVIPTGITNYTGDGFLIASNEIEMCVGDAFCFDLEFTDLNANDSIFITSNIALALPGATVTQTSWSSPAVVNVCWTATSSVASPTSVVFTARDNACPMFGVTFYPIIVNILTSTDAGPDQTICAGDSAYLTASGGTQFTWTAIPGGDTIIIGNTFSCDTCENAWAKPSVTTSYIVTSNLSGNCISTDTVTVNVVSDFNYSLTQSSTTSCINSLINFNTIVNPVGAYVYTWSPAANLDDPTIANPTLTPSTAGSFDYALEILGPSGCIKFDTLNVVVASAYSPDFNLVVNPTTLDCGDTVNLSATLNGGAPVACGLSPNTSCSATAADYVIGTATGSNTPNNYPAPFGNWYKNAKHQFVYTASELNAMGLTGGKITNLAFEITAINGDTIYQDYTIKMGCITDSILTFWQTGLSTVYSPQNYNIALGWNDFTFTSAYEWDGLSNIVVEICYNNLSTQFSQNSISPFMNTGYISTLYYRNDVQNACNAFASTPSSNRAIIRFTSCPTIPDPSLYGFEWTPAVNVDNINVDSTFAVPQINTTYQVVVTAPNGGCAASASVNVTVLCCSAPIPNITDVLCIGGNTGSVELSTTSNVPGPYIIHLIDPISNTILQADSNVVTTTTFGGLMAGNYQATFQDANGCTSDTLFTVVELQTLPVVSNDTSMCTTDSVLLIATNGVSFSWSATTNLSTPTNDSTYFTGAVSELVYVDVADGNGCMSRDSIQITVNALPVINISNDTAICINDTIPLSVNSIASTYSWSPVASVIDPSLENVMVFPSVSTNYKVIVTDAIGCRDSATVQVTVNALPILDAGLNDTICFGDTTQLNGVGVGTVSWLPLDSISDATILNPMVWPSVTSDYILRITDANTCVNYDTVNILVNTLPNVNAGADEVICIYDSVQLNASGATDYLWLVNSDLDNATISTPWSSTQATIDYIVQGTDANGCINVDTMQVMVNLLPIVDAGAAMQICIGDSAQLQAVGANSYTWSPSLEMNNPLIGNPLVGASDTTTYFVIGTDLNACSNVDSVIITVNPLPSITISPDVNICKSDTIQISASGGSAYSWLPSNSLSNSTIFDPLANPDTTTVYVVTVTDSNMCVNYDSTVVNVFRVSTVNDTTICEGQPVQLSVYGSPGTTYNWIPNYALTDNTISNPVATPDTTTTYTVDVSDLAGCQDQTTTTIFVNPIPIPNFGYTVQAGCDGIVVNVADSSVGIDTYKWTFSNGESSTEINPEVVFNYDGPFSIELLATTNLGCAVTMLQSSNADKFEDYYSIYIPNVFTPNGDGDNDTFLIGVPGELAPCLDVNIYNRWGQHMFSSFGTIIAWDGKTPEGDVAPEGTYMFTIEIKGKTYSGTVNLFR